MDTKHQIEACSFLTIWRNVQLVSLCGKIYLQWYVCEVVQNLIVVWVPLPKVLGGGLRWTLGSLVRSKEYMDVQVADASPVDALPGDERQGKTQVYAGNKNANV